MEPLGWVIMIIIGIGALAVAFFGLALIIAYWWILIPIILVIVADAIGGWFGIFFCLGLFVIVWVIAQGINSINKK